ATSWQASRSFEFERGVQSAFVRLAADFCRTTLTLNGRRLLVVDPYCQTQIIDVTSAMQRGKNELSLAVDRPCGPAAVALTLEVRAADGEVTRILSDGSWQGVVDIGTVRPELWGIGRAPATISPFENYEQWQQSLSGKTSKANAGIFVPPGFEVTR